MALPGLWLPGKREAMAEKRNNYQLQVMQAKRHFLTYDQQELITRCRLRFDETYFYIQFLAEEYRIHRKTGDMERLHKGVWIDGNGFGEGMEEDSNDRGKDVFFCGK